MKKYFVLLALLMGFQIILIAQTEKDITSEMTKRVYFKFYSNDLDQVKKSVQLLGYNDTDYDFKTFLYDLKEIEYKKNKTNIVKKCKYQLSMLDELEIVPEKK